MIASTAQRSDDSFVIDGKNFYIPAPPERSFVEFKRTHAGDFHWEETLVGEDGVSFELSSFGYSFRPWVHLLRFRQALSVEAAAMTVKKNGWRCANPLELAIFGSVHQPAAQSAVKKQEGCRILSLSKIGDFRYLNADASAVIVPTYAGLFFYRSTAKLFFGLERSFEQIPVRINRGDCVLVLAKEKEFYDSKGGLLKASRPLLFFEV